MRNNILVALADLCIQYTALVDTHVSRLAACLADPHELVRRQALALLANLLQKVGPRRPGRVCVYFRTNLLQMVGTHMLSHSTEHTKVGTHEGDGTRHSRSIHSKSADGECGGMCVFRTNLLQKVGTHKGELMVLDTAAADFWKTAGVQVGRGKSLEGIVCSDRTNLLQKVEHKRDSEGDSQARMCAYVQI